MHELGNVQHAAQDARALKPPRNELPDLAQETATITIADDDAAVAVIRNPWYTQDVQQDSQYPDALLSTDLSTETEPRTKAITAISESSKYQVYSDPSKLRVKLADEIKAINAYDGFLLGIYDKIEEFPERIEFNLEQVLEVEKRVGELYETLELYKFTLKRITAEALKSLQCQGNLGPERALYLLKETIANQNTDTQATEEQTAAAPEQNQ